MKSGMSRIERAVFDTNILISAYLWSGTPRRALEVIRAGHVELISSTAAIKEFIRVLGYPKFGFSPEEIAPFVEDLLSIARLVEPPNLDVIIADPSDNLFLGIAVKGSCQVAVSGDHHLSTLKRFRSIQIVTVPEFMRAMRTP